MRFIELFAGIGGFRYGLEKCNDTVTERTQQGIQQGSKSNTPIIKSFLGTEQFTNVSSRQFSTQSRRTENKETPFEQHSSLITSKGRADTSKLRCVYANEWDKYACQIYRKNYGEGELYEGDIRTISADSIPDHDLLVGGFPCQSFSIAGKRKGFGDTRGTLFFEICRIVEEKKPNLLLLENVKGLLSHDGGNTLRIIFNSLSELGYDCEWEVLNSKNFGVPQNRERVFIIGHLRGTSGQKIFPIGEGSRENYKMEQGKEISKTLRAGYYKQGFNSQIVYYQKADREIARIYDPKGLAPTLHLKTGGWQEPKIVIIPTNTKLGYDVAEEKKDGIRLQYENSKTARGRVIKGNAQALQVSGQVGVLDNSRIRRLTPTECERLQGFPDGWTEGISDTQRYKCLGNAVTTNVITEIGRKLI